jgi:NADH-quinone oxidoreductase subunit H
MQGLIEFLKPHALPLLYGVVIVAVLPLLAGYVVLLERKVMADMQARLGPMRVGPHGLLQPIADALKLLLKEDVIPDQADKWIFWMAPLTSVTAGLLAFAALPFGPAFLIADMNVGILFIVAVSSMGIFGIVLGGWASNSHYSLLGALRSAAQLVSYEVAGGMALVGGILLAGTLSTKEMVEVQSGQGVWFVFLSPMAFFIYLVASIAETNRAPFDMPEAESELVAGYMTEYSGFRWSLYFLAEYANMIVVAGIATTLFLGGWARPFASVQALNFLDFFPAVFFIGVASYCFFRAPKQPVLVQKIVMAAFGGLCLLLAAPLGLAATALPAWKAAVHGGFWFVAKVMAYIYVFLWIRFTFPRYRFDQLMHLGWFFLIPLSIVNVMALGIGLVLHREAGWNLWAAMGLSTVATLVVALCLAHAGEQRPGLAESEA